MTNEHAEEMIGEIRAVKKLLMLQLLAIGFKQKELAATLGVSEATLSRMLPKGIGKDAGRTANAE